jgi:hypothetical protein
MRTRSQIQVSLVIRSEKRRGYFRAENLGIPPPSLPTSKKRSQTSLQDCNLRQVYSTSLDTRHSSTNVRDSYTDDFLQFFLFARRFSPAEHILTSENQTVKMVNEKKTQPKRNTKKTRSAISDVVAREYTIHMHKRVR